MGAVILVIIVIVLVAIFSVQNAMTVAISFLPWQFDASLALIALLFFLGGMITGMGVLWWIQLRRKARKRSAAVERQPADGKASDVK